MRSHESVEGPRTVEPNKAAVPADQRKSAKPLAGPVGLENDSLVTVGTPPRSLTTDWAGTVVSDARIFRCAPKPLNLRVKRLVRLVGELF